MCFHNAIQLILTHILHDACMYTHIIYITVPLYDEFKWRAQQRYPDQNPVLLHMGSAVAAGAVADVLCNPAFVVRTRLQTEAVHRMQQATAAAAESSNLRRQ